MIPNAINEQNRPHTHFVSGFSSQHYGRLQQLGSPLCIYMLNSALELTQGQLLLAVQQTATIE
eukprot:scaffold466517_cov37-Prasinocladus_malaysianus.AAC.1